MKSSGTIKSAGSKISGSWNCEPVHIGISDRKRNSFRIQESYPATRTRSTASVSPHYNYREAIDAFLTGMTMNRQDELELTIHALSY